jgi:allantoinase
MKALGTNTPALNDLGSNGEHRSESDEPDPLAPGLQEPEFDLVVVARLILLDGEIAAGELGVRDGKIAALARIGANLRSHHRIALRDEEILIPGLVDSHVHVNEPGRTEWEGFTTATMAASAGGITTIIDMPLNSVPPTVSVDALRVKQSAARTKSFVDVGFWGGAVPGNTSQLAPLYEAGVFGFKCFLAESGVDEFPPLTVAELETDMAEVARIGGLMIVHAEDAATLRRARREAMGRQYRDFLASRPPEAESRAIATVIESSRRTGARAHILHVSSATALPLIAAAKAEGLPVTAETCPHYLSFAAEEIGEGRTLFKCCPPIRGAANRDLLWAGIDDGTIDCIVSDHSPSIPSLKDPAGGDFDAAWGGISSLQLGLPVMLTEAKRRGVSLSRIVERMSAGPAQLLGLARKGALAVGRDADFAILAPDEEWTVDASRLRHRNPITPYDGMEVTGRVRATYLRGEPVDCDEAPRGVLIDRE